MNYVLVNSAGKKLSGFYDNCGVKSRFLVYRDNDWYAYGTKAEAEKHLRYILKHGVGKNLRIVKAVNIR